MDVGDVEKNSQFSNWENYFAFIYLYCTCCKIVCNVCPFIERKIGSMERKVERLKYHRGYRAIRLFQVNFTPRSHPWCIHIRHPCICAQYRPAVYVPMRIDRVHGVIGRGVSRPRDAIRSVDNGYRHTARPIKYPPPINPLYSFEIPNSAIEGESERPDGARTTECYSISKGYYCRVNIPFWNRYIRREIFSFVFVLIPLRFQ